VGIASCCCASGFFSFCGGCCFAANKFIDCECGIRVGIASCCCASGFFSFCGGCCFAANKFIDCECGIRVGIASCCCASGFFSFCGGCCLEFYSMTIFQVISHSTNNFDVLRRSFGSFRGINMGRCLGLWCGIGIRGSSLFADDG
jgi:hypothetical protein